MGGVSRPRKLAEIASVADKWSRASKPLEIRGLGCLTLTYLDTGGSERGKTAEAFKVRNIQCQYMVYSMHDHGGANLASYT
jgi:hypothetical protein